MVLTTGQYVLLIVVLIFSLILIAFAMRREKNVKSSVVYFPTSTVAVFKKIQAIKKKYSCLETMGLNEAGTLFKVEFSGNKNKYKAADELDCYLNRRFEGHERHRV